VSEMRAGPELDALVAEKVMGLVPCSDWIPGNLGSAGGPVVRSQCTHAFRTCYPTITNGPAGGCPKYSTLIALAWQVIERLADIGHTKWEVARDADGYTAMFSRPRPGCTHSEAESSCGCWEWVQREGETAPLAICLAALACLT
jgi:hypothetical protein